MPVPIPLVFSPDGWWVSPILLGDSVVVTLYLQAWHDDLPALLLSEMTGGSGKQVARARENLLGLVIPAKPFAPDKIAYK